MGFFSGIRRRIKKLIPKEVRPFVPYLATMIPGLQAMGPLSGIGSMAARKALIAGGTKFLTDDEADLKDVGITAALAAAPDALGEFAKTGNAAQLSAGDPGFLTQQAKLGAAKLSGMAADKPFSTLSAQAGIDYGIKAAELNEDALADYNRMLAEQGIADKAGRRSAIRKIYENTGTWDMDEVDSMLDTYGYRTGGRVGYAEGSYVPRDQIEDSYDIIEKMDNELNPGIIDQIPFIGSYEGKYPVDKDQGSIMIDEIQDYKYGQPPGSFNSSGEIPERAPMSMEQTIKVLEDKYDQAVEEGYGLGEFESMGVYSKDDIRRRVELGYDSAKSNMSNTGIMKAANGGRVGYEKGGFEDSDFYNSFKYAKEGLESLEEAEDEIKPLPIRELRLARGGITDIEVEEGYDDGYGPDVPGMFEEIETTTEEDTSDMMASDPSPMDELDSLSLMLFRKPLSELTDDEYEDLKDFASQQSLKPGLIDEYRNYKYNAEEQGQTPMSPRDYFRMEFGAARMGVAKGGPIELNVNVGGNNMEDIKGQTAGPAWYQERIENLEFLFGDELTDEEIADIAFDSDKYYEKTGYEPGMKKGGKVIELMPKGILYKGKAKDYPGIKQLIKDMKKKGTRPKKADGGLMNLGGKEMDLRGGGFVPMGAKERADDVPARLSKNEFVMTADAVRGAGGGSVQKGADLMYDQMKRLEGQA